MEVRIERDELGEVAIPPRRYWGARTERRRTAAAAARSEAERRTLLPLCAYDFLQSARLLGSLLATD